jgi:hypothetical protein
MNRFVVVVRVTSTELGSELANARLITINNRSPLIIGERNIAKQLILGGIRFSFMKSSLYIGVLA